VGASNCGSFSSTSSMQTVRGTFPDSGPPNSIASSTLSSSTVPSNVPAQVFAVVSASIVAPHSSV
jgi:hypothetical protein